MPFLCLTGACFAWHRQRIIRKESKSKGIRKDNQRSKSNPEAQTVGTKRTPNEQYTSGLCLWIKVPQTRPMEK